MIKIAVKELATFLYSSGDLSYEFFYNSDKNDGTKAHQYLQKKYDKNSNAEVYIKRYEVINEIYVT